MKHRKMPTPRKQSLHIFYILKFSKEKTIYTILIIQMPIYMKDTTMYRAGPLKGATPRRGVWQHSRPLLPAETSATAASDLAVFLSSMLSLFVGEAQG